MLKELWSSIRGTSPRSPLPQRQVADLPESDEDESLADLESEPDYDAQPISGFGCIIVYRDAKGRSSERRVTCQSLSIAGEARYLTAYCHERRARRQFRTGRIEQVIDLHSGEIFDAVELFFDGFAVDRRQSSGLSWGLSVRQRADLVAGLNAMRFMGQCDQEWHPLERGVLERFVASFWIRNEIACDLPLEEIAAHADRLAPDAETFFVALMRCRDNKVLATIIRRQLQAMVDADGVIRAEEAHWGGAVDRFFARLND